MLAMIEVLADGDADVAVAVALGQVGDAAHLGRGDAADRHEQADVVERRAVVVRRVVFCGLMPR